MDKNDITRMTTYIKARQQSARDAEEKQFRKQNIIEREGTWYFTRLCHEFKDAVEQLNTELGTGDGLPPIELDVSAAYICIHSATFPAAYARIENEGGLLTFCIRSKETAETKGAWHFDVANGGFLILTEKPQEDEIPFPITEKHVCRFVMESILDTPNPA